MYGVGLGWRAIVPIIQIGDFVKVNEKFWRDIEDKFAIDAKSDSSMFFFEGATADGIIDMGIESWGILANQAYEVKNIYVQPCYLRTGDNINCNPKPYLAVISPVGPLQEGDTDKSKYLVPYVALEKTLHPMYYDFKAERYRLFKG